MNKYTFEVNFADGSQKTAEVDQRDIRRWESEKGESWIRSDLTVTATTEVAFYALRRTGQYVGSWDDFDAVCVWVREVDSDATDPTRTAHTDGPLSSSPSEQVSE